MHVKKGDEVIVIAGKDRAFRTVGEVLDVDRKKGRVKVHRANMIVKHRKPNPVTGDEGARIEKEGWIDASNVALYSEEIDGPVRTSIRWVGKGGDLYEDRKAARESFGDDVPERIEKVRYASKTDQVFDDV